MATEPVAATDDYEFILVLKRIFEQSMLMEIKNVVDDAIARNGNVEHCGHVLIISMLCALDAISSYGYGAKSGKQIPEFINCHFATEYLSFADSILRLYRHAAVHSWNLFEVAITPGDHGISETGNVISIRSSEFLRGIDMRDRRLPEQALARCNAAVSGARTV